MLKYEEEFMKQISNQDVLDITNKAQAVYQTYLELTEDGPIRNFCYNIIKFTLICLFGFMLCFTTDANILLSLTFFICLGISGIFSFVYLSVYVLPIKTWVDCIKDDDVTVINSYIYDLKNEVHILIRRKSKKWYSNVSEKVLYIKNKGINQ